MNTIHGTWNQAADAVTLIDAHHHLWDLQRNYYPWLSNRPEEHFFLGNYEQLKKNYLPQDYLRDARGHNVLATVHCEAEWDREDQVGETRWLSEVSALYGFPDAIVAHAWFDTENAEEVIAAQASFALVRGIRSKPATSLSPDTMTPGAPRTMQDDKWLRGFLSGKVRPVLGPARSFLAPLRGRERRRRLSLDADHPQSHRLPLGPERGGARRLASGDGGHRA